MSSYDEWLAPWKEQYYNHQRPLREAFESKDFQKISEAYAIHMPEMIRIRNEVAQLEIPSYWPASTTTKLKNRVFGMKDQDVLRIQQDAVVKVWKDGIDGDRHKYEKLTKKQR